MFGCGLWCLALLVVDRTQMPKDYRMSGLLRTAMWIAGLALAVAGGYTTWTSWLPLVKSGIAALTR